MRDPPKVNWFTPPYDHVSQRYNISDIGTRPKVLRLRSGGTIFAALHPIFELPFGQINLRVQFLEVLFIESPSNCLVDIGDRGAVPEI